MCWQTIEHESVVSEQLDTMTEGVLHIVANFQQQEIGTPIYACEIRESWLQPRLFLVGHTPFYPAYFAE
jgi:hypothetical protein